jgi:PTH1 family peptidyl-tRNA hydrolase
MILIVGLGNPGEKYKKTRHNLGFMVVDALARKWEVGSVKWKEDKKSNSLIINHQPLVILVKPQTMMNASGFAVKSLITNYQLLITNLWVIHDDVDLPLGKIKIRIGGAAAGHHGVESIIQELGTDKFVRFRLGIGHPGRGADALVERYVLREFDINEKTEVKQIIKKTVKAILVAIKDGLEKAMARKF